MLVFVTLCIMPSKAAANEQANVTQAMINDELTDKVVSVLRRLSYNSNMGVNLDMQVSVTISKKSLKDLGRNLIPGLIQRCDALLQMSIRSVSFRAFIDDVHLKNVERHVTIG